GEARLLATLPDGAWDGLTYDPLSDAFYSVDTIDGFTTVYALEVTGASRSLVDLPFEPSAIEIGPDGSLYAAHPAGGDTELYRIDTTSNDATLVGSMGVADVVSFATLRSFPRACAEIFKNGEQTIALDGACSGPPVADAGPDLRAECSSPAGATVLL